MDTAFFQGLVGVSHGLVSLWHDRCSGKHVRTTCDVQHAKAVCKATRSATYPYPWNEELAIDLTETILYVLARDDAESCKPVLQSE